MTGPFLTVPGAVSEDGVLQHVGTPLGEQRMLVQGQAIAPLGDRAVIEVSGVDRLGWLDSVTSQAVAGLTPGESTELLVLDPHGHVEHAAAVLEDGTSTWLVVDAADAVTLAQWLMRMRFRMRVEIRVADELSVVAGASAITASVEAAAPAGVPLIWRDPWPGITAGGHGYFTGEHPGAERDWVEILVTLDEQERLVAEGMPLAGALAAEALRIAAWRPRWSRDVDERTIPHEVDWLRTAVHLSKGCYRGQETVAKVHNLGHPPRRLVAVHLDGSGSVLPSPGSEIVLDGDVIGTLSAAALHFEEGPIGLGIVRRAAGEGDAVVMGPDGSIAASLETIVPADAGASARVPRMPRLSRRPAASPPPGAAPATSAP